MSIFNARPSKSVSSRRSPKTKTPLGRLAAAVDSARPSRSLSPASFEALEGRTLFAAPTLTNINTFGTAAGVTGVNDATEDTAYVITYAQLKSMSDVADADGDTIKFRIEAISTGTLKKGTASVVAGTTLVGAGDTLTWTPAANANGNLTAFTVKASDGTNLSSTAVAVHVTTDPVNDAPALTSVNTLTGGTEDTAYTIDFATLAAAVQGGTDVDGDSLVYQLAAMSSGKLTKNGVTVTPSDPLRSVLNPGDTWVWTPAANAFGTLNAFTIKTMDPSGLTSTTAAQVKITVSSANDAPTLTNVNTLTGASEDAPFTITYASLTAASNLTDVDGTTDTFRIQAVSGGTLTKGGASVTAGTTTLGVGESLVWTPASNVNGVLPGFTVEAYDGTLASSTPIQVNINVASVDDAPTLTTVDTFLNGTEDSSYDISYDALVANTDVSDIDSTNVWFKVTAVSSGTLTLDDGVNSGIAVVANTTLVKPGYILTWTPAANANGTAGSALTAFTVKANDGTLDSSTAIPVKVSVAAVPDAPTLTSVTTLTGASEDTGYSITFANFATAASEADADGDHVSFRIESLTSGTLTKGGVAVTAGTTTFDTGDTLIWTPDPNANGTLNAFTVRALDDSTSALYSAAPVQVKVAVTAVNDAPTLSSISTLAAATEDTAYSITYAQLLAASDAGDVDGGNTLFRIDAVSTGTLKKGTTAVTAGTTTLGVGETLTWTPAADANGVLNAFTVKAYDGTAASTTAIQVKVGVAAVNDAPVMTTIANLTGATEDTSFNLTYSALSTAAGATDVDSSTINFQITSLGTGTLTEDGLPVSVGKVITSADTLVWTPVANANGTATNALTPFSVKATDGALLSATAIAVKVNVANVNDAPTLSTISTLSGATEDTAFTITYATLAAASNANDIEGPVLFRIEAISGGILTKGGVAVTAGATTLGTGESLVWTPAANANGTGANAVNAFTVKAYDGALASPTATQVKVNVNAVNDAPTLSTISNLTGATEDTPYTITYDDLASASNLHDPDGTSPSFLISTVTTGTTLTKNGVAVVAGTTLVGVGDTLVWTPAANVNGTGVSAFTVKATDGILTTSTAVAVKVNITAVNDAPTLTSFTNLAGANEDATFNITYAALKAASNAADVESDTITFRIESVASGTLTKGGVAVTAGTTTVAAGDTLVWTPAANAYGTGAAGLPVMTVSAYDGTSYSTGPVLVKADVANVNDAPTLTTISTFTSAAAATEDTAYPVTYAALLAASNAADIDGPNLMFRVEAVSSGTLTKAGVPVVAGTTSLAPGESLIWTPASNANGAATAAFTVKAFDGTLASATAVPVLIDVTAVNDAPTFTAATTLTSATEDTDYSISFASFAAASNAVDPESDTIQYKIAAVSSGVLKKGGTAVAPGTTTFAAGDTLVWTPAADANGVLDAFTLIAGDGTAWSVTPVQVKVNVTAVNDDVPVDSGSVTVLTGGTEDTAQTITFAQLIAATGMTDPDPEQTISLRIETVISGTLTKNGVAIVPGTTMLATGESLVWTPAANVHGAATHAFTVKGYDGVGYSVASSAIDVNVAAVNDAPTLTTITTITTNTAAATPTEDTAFSIDFAYLDAQTNAADVDGDTLTYRIESVVNGTLTKSGAAVTPGTTMFATGDTLVWTPSSNVNGTIPAFTLVASDGSLFSSTPVTVNVAVTPVSDNPVLTTVNTFTKGIENTPLVISYSDLLANSDLSDADGGAVLFKIMTVDTGTLTKGGSAVTAGTTTLAAGETLTWTPASNANGAGIHAFTVKGWDSANASSTAIQVSVNIAHVLQMPTMTSTTNLTTNANSDVPTEDIPFSIAFADLTTDAIDPEGGALSYRIESIPAGVTLTKSGTAVVPGVTLFSTGDTLLWTPPANSNGSAMTAFTIRAVTAAGVSSSKVPVTVDVTAVNDTPTLTEIMPFNGAGEDQNPAFTITYAQLLANSDLKDVDSGDTLQFKIMVVSTGTLTKNGSAVVAGTTLVGAGDTLAWSSAANANGPLNAFTVKAYDGTVLSSTAIQVKVNVSPINDAPTFTTVATLTGASAGVAYSVTYAALTTAGNQADVDSGTINFVVGSVLSGTLTKNGVAVIPGVTRIKSGDTLVWTSLDTATGDTAAFSLFATDGQDLSASAVNVLITVT